jgi:hypothetical protein
MPSNPVSGRSLECMFVDDSRLRRNNSESRGLTQANKHASNPQMSDTKDFRMLRNIRSFYLSQTGCFCWSLNPLIFHVPQNQTLVPCDFRQNYSDSMSLWRLNYPQFPRSVSFVVKRRLNSLYGPF